MKSGSTAWSTRWTRWPRKPARPLPQIALNWLLQRPTVSSVLIGARDEAQLKQNLGALGWQLTTEQVARLDAASAVTPPYPYYPYWNGQFAERSPSVGRWSRLLSAYGDCVAAFTSCTRLRAANRRRSCRMW